jgi:hypothetical protein
MKTYQKCLISIGVAAISVVLAERFPSYAFLIGWVAGIIVVSAIQDE